MRIFCVMKRQKICCVVIDQNGEITQVLSQALGNSELSPDVEYVFSAQQVVPLLKAHKPHLLFCLHGDVDTSLALLEKLQQYSPDTLLVWISHNKWQGLTTWLMGVESCILPLSDHEYLEQYLDFLLRYSIVKQDFRQCKHLLSISELRCHWLADYSWEAIAYVSQGMHLYANHAYVSLFGFESMAELRSVPVNHLVDANARTAFIKMCRAADENNRISNRLLTTLRNFHRETLRAEVRFIPAVLKGKRCIQLHVRALDRPIRLDTVIRQEENPWETSHKRIQNDATTPQDVPMDLQSAPHVSPQHAPQPIKLAGMKVSYYKLKGLRPNLPVLYVAEPEFQLKPDVVLGYVALTRRLSSVESHFRLDYWNLSQAMRHLVSDKANASSYLVFVPAGAAIFNNDDKLKSLLELLNTSPQAARRIVLALQYTDCIVHTKRLPKVYKLLKAVGVHLAVDGLVPGLKAAQLLRDSKPAVVRLASDMIRRASQDKLVAKHLHEFIFRLNENKIQVIATGINNNHALELVRMTAAYVQSGAAEP